MKSFLRFLAILLPVLHAHAQLPGTIAVEDPVNLSIIVQDKGEGNYELVVRADIEAGWYVYSMQDNGDMGPMPTEMLLDEAPGLRLLGAPTETGEKVVEGMDPVFDMEVKKFGGYALFTQELHVADPLSAITGKFGYMACDDQRCIFPDPVYFRVHPGAGRSEMSLLPLPAGTGGTTETDPVAWAMRAEDLGGGRHRLSFDATVHPGWYIYSVESFGDMGPEPTSFMMDEGAHYRLLGDPAESGPQMVEGFDPVFEMNVRKFKETATFSIDLEVSGPEVEVTGMLSFMTCNDEACIFPDPVPFRYLPATGVALLGGEQDLGGLVVAGEGIYKLPGVDLAAPVLPGVASADTLKQGSSLLNIFFLGFIGGLLALLTPCVFPMIPLTVSFFTKGSEDKAKGLSNAVTYGLFILGIYLIFSLPFHLLGSVNPEMFNEISTNPWLNIFFFAIFIVFAISFFGYFEITLPSSWVNRMDQNASRFGGMIGIFFMALTLALVSFSCTGPILGSLLAGALTADGGAWQLSAGMGGFGLALALPFGLFAMFPRWLNSLPRSGSWLNSVKVVLGFAEVALAFKFLSMADLVMRWGILPYELFMAIWVLCGLGVVLYLFGTIRFPHDSPLTRITTPRWTFIALFGAFTIYMAAGFRFDAKSGTFAPVKLLSGITPSPGYSWIFPRKCPAGLNCYHDLESGMAAAQREGKPVLLDFTGYGCANCRKMEDYVWPLPQVHRLIEQEYILVSLYVDDKSELPEEEQHVYVTSTGKKKPILTVGNKWSTLQTETFVNNSQPYYALLSPDGTLLTDPVAYTPDAATYAAFLQRGISAMQQLAMQAAR
jgi:thiol:disulfide interchange protein DsbD